METKGLEQSQRMVLMTITGVLKSTPGDVLEVLMSMITAIRLQDSQCIG